ncbi:HEXXH motif-containing putative peptide modification protein [Nocardia sp. NPDC127579]|uniref:aKG-HExxH-type peptide beta-hydroxylase n=1 Tax=Nocardia sp. NPDC127579 TaxID=3345402 RepID=UPI0036377DEB
MEPEPGIFEAQPSPARAHLLRTRVNSLLREGLRRSIAIARSAIPDHAAAAEPVLDELDIDRRIAPAVFSLHRQISSGMREQDVTQVVIGLARLRACHDRGELFTDEIEVSTLRWDVCDHETAHYIYSSTGPRGPNDELPTMLPVPDFEQHAVAVRRAQDLLRVASPDMHGEVTALVSSIRLYDQRHIGSVSTPRSFGLMHLHLPTSPPEIDDPTVCFVDRITHETSHIALNAVMTQDKLVLNDPADRFRSPLRADPRPIAGIYHGTFVLSRVIHVLSRARAHHDSPALPTILEQLTTAFDDAHDTVAKHGQLSEAGQQILDSCRELVTRAT